jgi:hypothetical protein
MLVDMDGLLYKVLVARYGDEGGRLMGEIGMSLSGGMI